MMHVRHDYEYIVPFCPAVQLAHPGNMAIYCAADLGRYTHDHQVWEAAGKEGSAPTRPTAEQAAVEFLMYSTSYA